MKSVITVALGIILLYSSLSSRVGDFYRIRGLTVKGIGKFLMRVIYAAAGVLLIIMTLSGQL